MIPLKDVIINSKPYKILQQDVRQGKLSHSYMLISDDSETLSSFIDCMLQLIYCPAKQGCGVCEQCVLVEHGNNPNIYKLKKDGGIKVDDIKELIGDTTIAAAQNGYKTYVIEGAETMNEASQNKLLKTLEEPSQNVIIILATASESAMLSTIKSRTKKLYINVWNQQSLTEELLKIGGNEQEVALAVKFSRGGYTEAKALLTDTNFQNQYNKVMDILMHYTSSALTAKFCKHLGEDKATMLFSLSILEGIISGTIEDIISNNETELTAKYNMRSLANLMDLIIDTTKRLNSNCNPQAVATNFLLSLAEIKYLTATN